MFFRAFLLIETKRIHQLILSYACNCASNTGTWL